MRLALVALLAGCDGVFGLIEVHHPDAADMPDLVAHFRLDEPGPPMYFDTSGGHAGTCGDPRCPSATAGRIGGAVRFDGTDDRIDVAGGDEFDGTQAFTVALWMFTEELPGTGTSGCPVSKLFGISNRNSWQLCHDSNGRLVFWSSQQDLDTLYSRDPISLATWHHVAIRWNGTTKILSLDGIDIATRETGLIQFDTGAILIGSDIDLGRPHGMFQGAVDDVRIYNRELSTAEITMLAQQ